MELLEYWQIVRKRLWLITLLAAVAVAGTTYYTSQQVPTYRTTTTLFLNPSGTSALLPYYTNLSVQSQANSYAEFMRTRTFAQLVADEMDDGTTAAEVSSSISSQYVSNTQFFKITATHSNPAKAQQLANTTAKVFIAENLARQREQQAQAQAQQDPARVAEQERLRALQTTLQDELGYYGDRIALLESQLTELENELPSEALDERTLELRQQLNQARQLRVDVLASLADTQVSLASSGEETPNVDTAVVVDRAPLPAAPTPQRTPQVLLFALVAALTIGLGLAFLLEYVDYTFKTPEELDAAYGQPAIGVIGVIDEARRGARQAKILTLTQPRSPVAEAFRSLRTNIEFASPDEEITSLLITSAGPAEGKTVTAANLAVSLAQGGSKVILADTDLRKPRLHRLFHVPKEPGFSNLVIDPAHNIEAFLHSTEQENLWILPCGTLPPNPAELLGSPRAAQVMRELEALADIVVYDSPPAATVTDAVVMAARVNGVLQVIKAGSTRRDMVLRGRDVLAKVDAHILGPVLNQVRLSDLGYYSYYYYYGYYRDVHDEDVVEETDNGSWLNRMLGRNGHRRRTQPQATLEEE
jgi:succinoglycan biosynthesis transport protein ExoP